MEPTCRAKTTTQWRVWLERNHHKKNKVHLICHKKHTGKPSMTHRQAMEEAICFGWIDTTVKTIDEDTYSRCFVKRNKNSRWSTATLSYAKRLLAEGRMSEFGLKMYKEGLQKPTIDSGIGKHPPVPTELAQGLHTHPQAKQFFDALAPSYRRYYIAMVVKAKLPETKKKWVSKIITACSQGKKQF